MSRKLSQVTLNDFAQIRDALLSIHTGVVQWATFGYAKRDQIKFLKTGNGLENLAAEYPDNDVVYAVVSQVVPMSGHEVVKNLLVTLVGENCSGIKKARSAAHRGEFGDYVIEFIPLSSHFQANDPNEICVEEFFSKLRVDPSARAKWKRQQGEKVAARSSGVSKLDKTNFGHSESVKKNLDTHNKIVEDHYRTKAAQKSNGYRGSHSPAEHAPRVEPEVKPAEPEAPVNPETEHYVLPPEEQVALSSPPSAPEPESEAAPAAAAEPEPSVVPEPEPYVPEPEPYVAEPEPEPHVLEPVVETDPELDASPAAPTENVAPAMFCGECGAKREEGCRFCGECGVRLE